MLASSPTGSILWKWTGLRDSPSTGRVQVNARREFNHAYISRNNKGSLSRRAWEPQNCNSTGGFPSSNGKMLWMMSSVLGSEQLLVIQGCPDTSTEIRAPSWFIKNCRMFLPQKSNYICKEYPQKDGRDHENGAIPWCFFSPRVVHAEGQWPHW